jgi:hypothetical protein
MTESTPAPTSEAAFSGSIVPDSRPILASATSSGRAVAVRGTTFLRRDRTDKETLHPVENHRLIGANGFPN